MRSFDRFLASALRLTAGLRFVLAAAMFALAASVVTPSRLAAQEPAPQNVDIITPHITDSYELEVPWFNAHFAKEAAMEGDARSTTHPIQQRVATEAEANSAFDDITYKKGQSFLRMLESFLGENIFREGIRQYIAAHKYSNTTTADLWNALSEASNKSVGEIAAGWTEQLTRALDYRSWHAFTIQRLQDGQWRPATGPASGGERVLAASVPLFAAASAHYKSAGNPYAPRLVALDEAFAGVDDDSRAKCLGLLATFDMDVVMTSEREWGCYPQVPGLSICQLTRRDGIDAVLVTPWRWDGRERTRADEPDPEPATGQADIFE